MKPFLLSVLLMPIILFGQDTVTADSRYKFSVHLRDTFKLHDTIRPGITNIIGNKGFGNVRFIQDTINGIIWHYQLDKCGDTIEIIKSTYNGESYRSVKSLDWNNSSEYSFYINNDIYNGPQLLFYPCDSSYELFGDTAAIVKWFIINYIQQSKKIGSAMDLLRLPQYFHFKNEKDKKEFDKLYYQWYGIKKRPKPVINFFNSDSSYTKFGIEYGDNKLPAIRFYVNAHDSMRLDSSIFVNDGARKRNPHWSSDQCISIGYLGYYCCKDTITYPQNDSCYNWQTVVTFNIPFWTSSAPGVASSVLLIILVILSFSALMRLFFKGFESPTD